MARSLCLRFEFVCVWGYYVGYLTSYPMVWYILAAISRSMPPNILQSEKNRPAAKAIDMKSKFPTPYYEFLRPPT